MVVAEKGASVNQQDHRVGGFAGFRKINIQPVVDHGVAGVIEVEPGRL
jgi:hypothetical protein